MGLSQSTTLQSYPSTIHSFTHYQVQLFFHSIRLSEVLPYTIHSFIHLLPGKLIHSFIHSSGELINYLINLFLNSFRQSANQLSAFIYSSILYQVIHDSGFRNTGDKAFILLIPNSHAFAQWLQQHHLVINIHLFLNILIRSYISEP